MRGSSKFSLAAIVAAGLIAGAAPQALAQNQMWLNQFGSGAGEQFNAIASDGAGGTFLGALTRGSLGGPNAGNYDALLVRVDSAGSPMWMTQFGTSVEDSITAVVPDSVGGVFAAGYTRGSLGGANQGENDVYLIRYDSAGNVVWTTQFGSSADEYSRGLASDGAGGVFATGFTYGSLGGPTAGDADGFIAHYDGAGNQLWIRQVGTSGWDGFSAVASDAMGGAWAVGSIPESFGPNYDLFITRFDSAGNLIQTSQFGSIATEDVRGIAPDGAGGLILTGVTEGSLGGPNAGEYDAFIAQFNASGAQVWLSQLGTSEGDSSRGVALDDAGRAVIAGNTNGSLGGPYSGATDIFMACYSIHTDSCYADCDHSTGVGVLDIFDFLCFQDAFVNGCP